MENEKLTYINSRGERLELGVDSVYHCNISKDVEGISGVTSVIYSTNSMGQHGDTYAAYRGEGHRRSGTYQHTGQGAGIGTAPPYA